MIVMEISICFKGNITWFKNINIMQDKADVTIASTVRVIL